MSERVDIIGMRESLDHIAQRTDVPQVAYTLLDDLEAAYKELDTLTRERDKARAECALRKEREKLRPILHDMDTTDEEYTRTYERLKEIRHALRD